jgi:hypothetical protein
MLDSNDSEETRTDAICGLQEADIFSLAWGEMDMPLMDSLDLPAYSAATAQQEHSTHCVYSGRSSSSLLLQGALSGMGMRQLLPQQAPMHPTSNTMADHLSRLHYPSMAGPEYICSDMPYFSGHASVFVPVSDAQKVGELALPMFLCSDGWSSSSGCFSCMVQQYYRNTLCAHQMALSYVP